MSVSWFSNWNFPIITAVSVTKPLYLNDSDFCQQMWGWCILSSALAVCCRSCSVELYGDFFFFHVKTETKEHCFTVDFILFIYLFYCGIDDCLHNQLCAVIIFSASVVGYIFVLFAITDSHYSNFTIN